jgi:hypothetical protein
MDGVGNKYNYNVKVFKGSMAFKYIPRDTPIITKPEISRHPKTHLDFAHILVWVYNDPDFAVHFPGLEVDRSQNITRSLIP